VIAGAVVVAVAVTAVIYFVFNGSSQKTVKAQFPEAIGIYTGTPVKILGVNVGQVTGVHPTTGYVEVTMSYDSSYKLSASAEADEVANPLVSDRYIQLTPLYDPQSKTDKVLADGATITKTGGPAELDQIYAQLNQLAVALGPQGANKDGALSTLLKVAAANLQGNGTALGNSITKLAAAAQTLSSQRGNLFATVQNLQKFTDTLKNSDAQVRLFNQQLAQVASDLASERGDLGAALQQLGLALDSVASFVRTNASKFHTDINGLKNVLQILVNQKASLNETLAIAPVALANIVHAYEPATGTIGTRSNLLSLTQVDPAQIVCGLLSSVSGGLPAALGGLTKSLQQVLTGVCSGAGKLAGSSASASSLTSTSDSSSTQLGQMLLGAGQ
ncbi:MAG: MCE family protein, partial [Actinobacteria bacterium]|nr:MCE family protein [Actinomycetota bacterium]